jgi:hypothetical protein
MEPVSDGGWLWLVIDVLFVTALAAALVYGTIKYHRRYGDATPQERSRAHDQRRHRHEATGKG